MIKKTTYILLFLGLFSCQKKVQNAFQKEAITEVKEDGKIIEFPDVQTADFFTTEKASTALVEAELNAPAKVAATVLSSSEGANQNIILFDNPELAGNYTQLIQHQININQIQKINIKQKQLELSRTEDLYSHGTATGQELLNAQAALSMEQTHLANEKAALIEHETKLKSGGFDPEVLRVASAGTLYIICDIPENQIGKIYAGQPSNIVFTAFPNEKTVGKVDAIADIVDNVTRMAKVRITTKNVSNKLKAGMFANVSFDINEGQFITISKMSLVTVQGKSYVFIKKSDTEFERKEIQTGQQIGNRIIVFDGLNDADAIVVEGVMQLKGLSFGY